MRIYSPDFHHEDLIPQRFTCDGEDVNPRLRFDDIPKEAKSLVLIVDDPDSPSGTWVHWLVFDIEPSSTEIPSDSVPSEAGQGVNDFGNSYWGGPCPGSGEHRYFFKLYALDTTLNLQEPSKPDLLSAMEGHILDKCEIFGRYLREK